ncbi:MAG TPA: hypothetical protein PK631_00540 [Erysipelotrichaceae bacterium]|nr:hypothetical protein [Erysipelotrichaceae bacterium]
MKKIRTLFFFVIILFSLTGCFPDKLSPDPKPDPDPADTGLTQEELWDYLTEYDCFATVLGLRHPILIFENDDDMTMYSYDSFSPDIHTYTELISFSYEGNYLYRLEYENPYPTEFESIFYFRFVPSSSSMLTNVSYIDGEEYVCFFYGNKALTVDQIMKILGKYEYWLEEKCITGHYFINIKDNDVFGHGIMNTEYFRNGTISKAEYEGLLTYKITIDYPAREASEMDDGYPAYCKTHKLVIGNYVTNIAFETDLVSEPFRWFFPEIELTISELFEELADKVFKSEDSGLEYSFKEENGRYYIMIHDTNTVALSAVHEVVKIKYQGYGWHIYEFTINDGNGDQKWHITYNPNDRLKLGVAIYDGDNLTFCDEAEAPYIYY